MDEKAAMEKRYGKTPVLPIHQKDTAPYHPTVFKSSRARTWCSFTVHVLLVLFLFNLVLCAIPALYKTLYPLSSEYPEQQRTLAKSNHSGLIPLEAHIMSKCPDAKDCLVDLVVPAMEQIVDKVDFRLSYIGTVDSNETIHCMHGSTECLGNMLSLCSIELYPNKTIVSLGFTTCMISSYQRIPSRELVESCALEHGIPFQDLNACVSDEGKGLDLLVSSARRSEKAGVKKSCTIRVGGENWCIRDGGEWKECDGGHKVKDLVNEVERRYMGE